MTKNGPKGIVWVIFSDPYIKLVGTGLGCFLNFRNSRKLFELHVHEAKGRIYVFRA